MGSAAFCIGLVGRDRRTSWLIKMGQVCKIVTGFEYSRVHQRRQSGIGATLEPLNGDLDGLGLERKNGVRQRQLGRVGVAMGHGYAPRHFPAGIRA